MSHLIKQLLLSNAYWVLNKEIVKTLGLEPAFILGVFADGESTLADENGWFYQTSSTITELTGLTNHKQSQAISKLTEIGVLSQENRGIPCKRYFKINYENLEKLVLKNFENCSSKNLNTSLQKISNNKESIIKKVNQESSINVDVDNYLTEEQKKFREQLAINKAKIQALINEYNFKTTPEHLLKLAGGDCELIIRQFKNYAHISLPYLINSIKGKYEPTNTKKENNKVEINTKDEFFKWYGSKITVLNIAYDKDKFTGEQKEWAEEILRKEGRI